MQSNERIHAWLIVPVLLALVGACTGETPETTSEASHSSHVHEDRWGEALDEPGPMNDAFRAVSERTGVPRELLMALAFHQSRLDEPLPEIDVAELEADPYAPSAEVVFAYDDPALGHPDGEGALRLRQDQCARLAAEDCGDLASNLEVGAQLLVEAIEAAGVSVQDATIGDWEAAAQTFLEETGSRHPDALAEILRQGFDLRLRGGERVAIGPVLHDDDAYADEADMREEPEMGDGDIGASSSALSRPGNWSPPHDVYHAGQRQYVAYEGAPAWRGGAGCSGRFTDGAQQLGDYILRTFRGQARSYGGYSCRPNTANTTRTSVHGTGRAIDVFVPTHRGSADNDKGDAIANWLIKNAEAIGVQFIIWDRASWGAHRSGSKHRRYTGPHPHHDHLHIEITSAAAARRTAWFRNGGRAPTPDGYRVHHFVGDWNGDGVDTPGFFHRSVWVLSNRNGSNGEDARFGWGPPHVTPIVGDWNGDGIDTPGWFHESVWVLSNRNGPNGEDARFGWGPGHVTPIVGDWDGDRVDTPGWFHESLWVLSNRNGPNGEDARFGWGPPDVTPIVGDWNGDGADTPGWFRRSEWAMTDYNASSGQAAHFGWGHSDAEPLVGDWNGDGMDRVGTWHRTKWSLSQVLRGGGVWKEFGWGR